MRGCIVSCFENNSVYYKLIYMDVYICID